MLRASKLANLLRPAATPKSVPDHLRLYSLLMIEYYSAGNKPEMDFDTLYHVRNDYASAIPGGSKREELLNSVYKFPTMTMELLMTFISVEMNELQPTTSDNLTEQLHRAMHVANGIAQEDVCTWGIVRERIRAELGLPTEPTEQSERDEACLKIHFSNRTAVELLDLFWTLLMLHPNYFEQTSKYMARSYRAILSEYDQDMAARVLWDAIDNHGAMNYTDYDPLVRARLSPIVVDGVIADRYITVISNEITAVLEFTEIGAEGPLSIGYTNKAVRNQK